MSLDILCVSIHLKVYFVCPVIIQFHPLPPQWRRCQKGTREASSSIHYRHNGGDARKAHMGRSNYGESRYFVCFHPSESILLMSCYHPVPSITATMEDMRERHTLSIQFHPLPPQWRRCQKGTHEACSSTHYTATMEEMPERHMLAGQIMVSLDILCDLRGYFLCPVIIQFHRSITTTMERIPERHT